MSAKVRIEEHEGRRQFLLCVKTRSEPFISLQFVHLHICKNSLGKIVKNLKFSMSNE